MDRDGPRVDGHQLYWIQIGRYGSMVSNGMPASVTYLDIDDRFDPMGGMIPSDRLVVVTTLLPPMAAVEASMLQSGDGLLCTHGHRELP